jgi:hypothetical protein
MRKPPGRNTRDYTTQGARTVSIARTLWTSAQVEDIELAKEAVSEMPMEARIARLEAVVSHLRSEVADIKDDVRSLRDRMETKFDAVIAAIAVAKVWALLLYVSLAAGMFSTMARAFGWI